MLGSYEKTLGCLGSEVLSFSLQVLTSFCFASLCWALSAWQWEGLGQPSCVKKVLRILTENIFPRIRPTPQRPILLWDFVTFNLFVISILFLTCFLNLLAAKFLEALTKDCIIDSLWTRGRSSKTSESSHSAKAYEVRRPGETQNLGPHSLGQQAVQESRNVSVNSNQQPAPLLTFSLWNFHPPLG